MTASTFRKTVEQTSEPRYQGHNDSVGVLFSFSGYEVMNISTGVLVPTFVEKAKEFEPQVVGLSGFLTLAFDSMKQTIEAFEEAGSRS
jgi:5-methyltetrahydrofolate--homocysteine methyltransferase